MSFLQVFQNKKNRLKLYLKEIGFGGSGVDLIHLAEDSDQWQAFVYTMI
jgi:hypothetical protein